MNGSKSQTVFKNFLGAVQRLFSHRFTFMVIPHGMGNPKQINIHLSHVLLFLTLWTAVTGWGSYLSAQHVDYWRTKLSNQVLKLKVNYLISQLDQSSGFIDEVKQIEGELKDLLKYKDEASLIKDSPRAEAATNTGGPSLIQQNDLSTLLLTSGHDISWASLTEKVGVLRNEARRQITSYDQLKEYIQFKRVLFRSTPLGWPYNGPVTSHYGRRVDPFSKLEEFHCGVDISGPTGAPIKSTADGVVRMAKWYSGYGNLVLIEHSFGYSTRYGHNSKLLVKAGDKVKRGQVIALLGSTGRASGPHSHYEVWRYNKRLNPFTYFNDPYATSNNRVKSSS